MKDFKLAVVSDIHLGHKRNTTEFILANLKAAFPNNAETAELDMIVLAGDVFDGLLQLPDEVIYQIELEIIRLLKLCKSHDIVLRVLEGTPSHDWKQSVRFKIHNEEIGCDFQYVDKLAIEYIEKFDSHMLYVPDEWDDSTEKTLSQVHQLMTLKNIKKVDYAFMHGQFEHQLPDYVKAPKHSSKSYLSIVDKLIFIGHVHVFSVFERIIAQGSFDRLSHGEEEAKGHVRAVVRSSEDYELKFVENVGARKFITIECAGLDLNETLKEIITRVATIPDGAFVRVSCLPDNPILTSMDQLISKFPLITWSKKEISEDEEKERIKDETLDDETFVPITITRDNIAKLVLERLMLRETPVHLQTRAEQLITEMK